ncbi:MAG: two-component regulator propeller domain-containing protein [Bacteroidota bacterium]
MLEKIYLLQFIFLFIPALSYAQDIAIGQWMDHLPYHSVIKVTEVGDKIYCATNSSVFSYNKQDNLVERLTKVTGLSDVGVNTIAYNNQFDVLILAYTNANVDLITNNTIINISDIKRKIMTGKKTINNIFFIDEFAYLSCSFGVVVLDIIKREIKDTYYLLPEQIEVFEMVYEYDTLFAATDNGLFKASVYSPNLLDFASWEKDTRLPDGVYNTITAFNDQIYINYSNLPYDTLLDDTLFVYNGNSWSYFDTMTKQTTYNLESLYDKLIITNYHSVSVYDINGNQIKFYDKAPSPYHAIIDKDDNVWIADSWAGLIKNDEGWGRFPNGPLTDNVFAMTIEQGNLWVAPGGLSASWSNVWNSDGIFSCINNQWETIYSWDLNSAHDIVTVLIDPSDENIVYAGSWGSGVIKIINGKPGKIYDDTNSNSSLQSVTPGESNIRIGGLAFDDANNLWVTNAGVENVISVKKADGTWKAFNLGNFNIGEIGNVGSIIIDSYNQKWILIKKSGIKEAGILVYDDNNTIDDVTDDQVKHLKSGTGKGNLPTSDVICITKDMDGEIWVGTTEGVAVFYSPELLFSANNFDAQQILIEQGGYYQYLLETEAVTAIAVDGANRKWIGTDNAGVFLMASDGTEQILHFDENNSPLLSKTITSIAINHDNGEVFFGTDKGIISYKSTATRGDDKFLDVYAYPNPVREDYEGVIAIKGLVTNSDVKITDISGILVYKTIAEGGQATWSGKNLNGEKVHTGVYLVFCSNEDGSETIVTKILVIN